MRKILLDIAKYAIENLQPHKVLSGVINKKKVAKFKRIIIIGIGKAAKGMADAVIAQLGRKPDAVILADRGHPFPTHASVTAAKNILRISRKLKKEDLAIVLISGGGSSMLALPALGLTLKDKVKVTHRLLDSGANINEINIVRKHISAIKGGGLASALYPARILGFVISDAVGSELGTIASGPLSPDPSTFRDTLRIVKKYEIKLPINVHEYLKKGCRKDNPETPKADELCFKNVFLRIVADQRALLMHAARRANEKNMKVYVVKKSVTGEAALAARLFMSRYSKKRGLVIAAGETTVSGKKRGFGGRNQEFALTCLKYLKPKQTLVSIGTDGVDGICPEKTAGAAIDEKTLRTARSKKLSIKKYLRLHDSYGFFKKTGGLIKTGATGTNVGDLIMLMNYKPSSRHP